MNHTMPEAVERLVILQSQAQSEKYAAEERRSSDLVLPIGPEAMHAASTHGWRTRSLGELSTVEQYNAARDASHARVEQLISDVDAFAESVRPGAGLEMGHYYAFRFWGTVGHLHYIHFVARSIAENVRPRSVLAYSEPRGGAKHVYPDPKTILAHVLSATALFPPDSIAVREVAGEEGTHTLRELVVANLPARLLPFLRRARNAFRIKNDKSAAHRLLLIGGEYEWIRISKYGSFRKLFSLHAARPLRRSPAPAPSPRLVKTLNDAVSFDGAAAFDLTPLASVIEGDLIAFARAGERLRRELAAYEAVISGILVEPLDSYVAHTAAKLGLPVVIWQHGEKGQSNDVTIPYTETYYATDFLTYGDGVSAQYRQLIGRSGLVSVRTVGSLGKRVDWIGGKTIVYATGKWFDTSVPFSELADPDTRLFRAHETLLPYLDAIADRPVILKANNTAGSNSIPYRLTRVRVDYGTPFTELLATAGAIILDSPATTLVEACSTGVPIFALGGRTAYYADFLDKVKRRVVWCETPEELAGELRAYVERGEYRADSSDDLYLQDYCAALAPEIVVERVTLALSAALARRGVRP